MVTEFGFTCKPKISVEKYSSSLGIGLENGASCDRKLSTNPCSCFSPSRHK